MGRIRSAKRPLILPNGDIGEHIVKELVLREEQSTTESEPDGSEESDYGFCVGTVVKLRGVRDEEWRGERAGGPDSERGQPELAIEYTHTNGIV